MGIPYQETGIGIALIAGIWAILTAETLKARLFIAAVMAAIFFIPVVWHSKTARLISFLAWIVFGMCCYIFIRFRTAGTK